MKKIAILCCLAATFFLNARERMIYVARHCQAGSSIIKPIDGDAGITPLGVKQAKLLGQRLKELNFNGPIFASPYFRTVATACHAASVCGSKVYPDARVQERVHSTKGVANMRKGGARLEQFRKLFPDQIAPDAKLAYPWLYTAAEPKNNMKVHQKRMADALDAILKEYPDCDIMIVSHAGAVGVLAKEMEARSGMKCKGSTWNCALFKYAVNDKGEFRFAGYEIGFLPDDSVTSNKNKISPRVVAQAKLLQQCPEKADKEKMR